MFDKWALSRPPDAAGERMHRRTKQATRIAVLICIVAAGPALLAQDSFDVCKKVDLIKSLAYVYYGCGEICDKTVMKQLDTGIIDRYTLMGILSSPRLTVRHVFFEENETDVKSALDFDLVGPGSKSDQLRSLKVAVDKGGMLFVIGKASTTDEPAWNETLSKDRMESVRNYLREIGVTCDHTKGGWFGEETFQFDESDAGRLNIRPHEYRAPSPEDLERLGSNAYREKQREARLVLNQAVHIIFVPCSPQSLFVEHRGLIWYHHRNSLRGSAAKRSDEAKVRDTLFRNDANSSRFEGELCTYCLGKGPKPTGTPADASAREACELVRAVRLQHESCQERPR